MLLATTLVLWSPAQAQEQGREWPMAANNYANTRFSNLQDLHAGNVKDLQLSGRYCGSMVGP